MHLALFFFAPSKHLSFHLPEVSVKTVMREKVERARAGFPERILLKCFVHLFLFTESPSDLFFTLGSNSSLHARGKQFNNY